MKYLGNIFNILMLFELISTSKLMLFIKYRKIRALS